MVKKINRCSGKKTPNTNFFRSVKIRRTKTQGQQILNDKGYLQTVSNVSVLDGYKRYESIAFCFDFVFTFQTLTLLPLVIVMNIVTLANDCRSSHPL